MVGVRVHFESQHGEKRMELAIKVPSGVESPFLLLSLNCGYDGNRRFHFPVSLPRIPVLEPYAVIDGPTGWPTPQENCNHAFADGVFHGNSERLDSR